VGSGLIRRCNCLLVTGDGALPLIQSSRGGRVAHTLFLDPSAADSIGAELRRASVDYIRSGGYPGADRTVLTSFPSHIPMASTTLVAVFFEGAADPPGFIPLLKAWGVPLGNIGDLIFRANGIYVITFPSNLRDMTADALGSGIQGKGQEVPLSVLGKESTRHCRAVVASLRVDSLGAKAFRVSRSFFRKGIDVGNVTVNGLGAKKSDMLIQGDQAYAKGLGRFQLVEVLGETRKGNLRVDLEVELFIT
jgi:RNA-binding protein YlmH